MTAVRATRTADHAGDLLARERRQQGCVAEERNSLELVAEQEHYRLYALLRPVHVVAKEHIVGIWREATHLEQSQEVMILTMNVPTDIDGTSYLSHPSTECGPMMEQVKGGVGELGKSGSTSESG